MAQAPTGYCAACLATNKQLATQLNTTLKQLKAQGIIDVIESKWMDATINLSAVPVAPAPAKDEKSESTEKTAA